MWYNNAIEKMTVGKTYGRQEIYNMLLDEKKSLTRNSFNWIMSSLLKEGVLTKDCSRGMYVLSSNASKTKKIYQPTFSEKALDLIRKLEKRFPLVDFVVFESVQLNEFLNHLIAQNTFFIMAERDVLEFIFRYLQNDGLKNILLKPSIKEWDSYWTGDSIILLNKISEAPKNQDISHGVCLERLLVDIVAETTMQMLYNKSEIERIYHFVDENYRIDRTKLLRYASRRGKAEEVKKYLGDE